VYAPTTGMVQGIATIDGQAVADARVSLLREGTWVGDLQAQYDGWYGAIELQPGNYTVVIQSGDRQNVLETTIQPGQVTGL
jgi:hypothetical protein